MSVLLLSPVPPPIGGIASWTLNITQYYAENDNLAIDLIHQNTAMRYRSVTRRGIFNRVITGIGDSLRVVGAFLVFLFKYKPDVIHLTSSASLGLIKDLCISLLARIFCFPIVIHYRFGRIPEICASNSMEWRILRLVTFLCSAAIVLDEQSYQTLRKSGLKGVYKIPNPISLYVESLVLKNNNSFAQYGQSRFNVIFVGHVVRNKGVYELVHACSLINNIEELTLIGPYEQEIREELLNISADSKLNIKFTGSLCVESVLNKMAKATLLVLPSYSEGFPNVIIEAMAMKCPVVATNVGAIADILAINSSSPAGLVVEPRNIQALVESISIIAYDIKLSDRLRQSAFIRVNENYTLKVVCDQYETLWESVK